MSAPIPHSVKLLVAGAAFSLVPALGAPSAYALQAPAAPAAPASAPAAAAPAGNGAMTVIVAEVKGTVQVSTDDGKTWTAAKPDMRLDPGAQFRTGFRSSVTCVIPPDQQFTLESLGTVRVAEAAKAGKRVKTDLVMKYGATNYQIEAAGAEHESTIRTPGSTLSVRGTVVRVTDRPGFAPTAESFTGRALYRTARTSTYLGKKGGGYARATAAQPDSAQAALSQTVVDPATALARTATDARLIAQQTSLGALASFDTRENITVISGGPGPLSDAQLAQSLPGTLDFVLRWTGNAHLTFFVTDEQFSAANVARGQQIAAAFPAVGSLNLPQPNLGQVGIINSRTGFQPQELLYPGFGLNVSPSGGTIPYDHHGGPNGGMEIAYWLNTPPQGIFGVNALHVSGAPADYKINAFLDGKPLDLFTFTATGDQVRSTTYSGRLTGSPNDDSGAIVFSPSNPFYSNAVPEAGAAAATAKVPPASSTAAARRPAAARPAAAPVATAAARPVPTVASPAPLAHASGWNARGR